jgi:hypothetical protein
VAALITDVTKLPVTARPALYWPGLSCSTSTALQRVHVYIPDSVAKLGQA